jgi:radical SAM protein with 4Fe4S-binding SPASM domain
MSFELAKSLIEQGSEIGVHSIKYNGRGESTMHPRFKDITWLGKKYAKGRTYIDRITNSNFYFRNNRDEIFEGLANQTKVKVSFDSFNKEVFEKQRTGASYYNVLTNVSTFYHSRWRIKSDTQLVIQAVRTQLNKDEDIEGEVKKLWPEAILSVRDMVGGRVDKDVSDLENLSRDNRERQSCIQAHARLIVHHDGKVAPCCPAFKGDLIIGDTNKDSLYHIYNSLNAKTLRKELLNGEAFKLDPCKTCSSHESYKGYIPNKES